MDESLVLSITVFNLMVLFVGYLLTRNKYIQNGGFLLTPIPLVVVNYILIFIYRPFVIFFYDGETLDYENIELPIAFFALQYGACSLLIILIVFFGFIYFTKLKARSSEGGPRLINIDPVRRLVFIGLFLNFMLIVGLMVYGSALNNTAARMISPNEYKLYFVFVILQRFYIVASAVSFFYFLNSCPSVWRKALYVLIVIGPILNLFTAGRGAAFYLLIAYFVIYVFSRKIHLSWVCLLKVVPFCFLIFLLNYLFSVIRVIISAPDWNLLSLVDSFSFFNGYADVESLIISASWDYSVFDVFIRILNNNETHTFGATNISYYLSYIPRVLWADKPLDQGFMLYITSNFYGDVFQKTGSTFAGTIVGEGFLNFGFLGVVLYSILFSLALFFVYRKVCENKESIFVVIYALALPFAMQVVRGGLDNIGNFVLSLILPLLLVNYFVTVKFRSSAVSKRVL